MHDPSPKCLAAARGVLSYLYKSKDKCIRYGGEVRIPDGFEAHSEHIARNFGFYGHSDSSWGNDTPYPMFGFSVFLANGPICFISKLLKVVAWSSCEAEYAATAYCAKEIAFVRQLLLFLQVDLYGPIILGVDNTAAIDCAENMGVTPRTKHFKQAMHYFRDCVHDKWIKLLHITTDKQLADWFTKILDKTTFLRIMSKFLHRQNVINDKSG